MRAFPAADQSHADDETIWVVDIPYTVGITDPKKLDEIRGWLREHGIVMGMDSSNRCCEIGATHYWGGPYGNYLRIGLPESVLLMFKLTFGGDA